MDPAENPPRRAGAGERVMELLREGQGPRGEFLSREALRNAYALGLRDPRGLHERGCSTCSRSPHEGRERTDAGGPWTRSAPQTPVLTDLKPGGPVSPRPDMETAGRHGGCWRHALRELGLVTDAPDGFRATPCSNSRDARTRTAQGRKVIRPRRPAGQGRAEGLRSSPAAWAPRGMRPEAGRSRQDPARRSPRASFDSEEAALRRGSGRDGFQPGRRHRHPLRGTAGEAPGMREIARRDGGRSSAADSETAVALITDGPLQRRHLRLHDLPRGPPRAAAGRPPSGLVPGTGDRITIDLESREAGRGTCRDAPARVGGSPRSPEFRVGAPRQVRPGAVSLREPRPR